MDRSRTYILRVGLDIEVDGNSRAPKGWMFSSENAKLELKRMHYLVMRP